MEGKVREAIAGSSVCIGGRRQRLAADKKLTVVSGSLPLLFELPLPLVISTPVIHHSPQLPLFFLPTSLFFFLPSTTFCSFSFSILHIRIGSEDPFVRISNSIFFATGRGFLVLHTSIRAVALESHVLK
ncbi:hypothetical protein L6452_03274 [Arctium lappa]|uniref:Uncharacterized protein n=1 Tax=Arctium lappa TaxID=4217 RepID=A0ACB9FLV5_ARCLA|nr:hypothetical protein L6452_03274 [Arctium lappa]